MRLGWTTSKYSTTYRAVKTVRINGKNKTMIVKSFGSEKFICETYGVSDAKAWAREQVRLMNEAEKEDAAKFTIELCAGTDLVMDQQRRFNGGYLFLQDIYYELGLDKICRAISARYLFEYDLNDILSRLIYTRILFPPLKRAVSRIPKDSLNSPLLNSMMFTGPCPLSHRNPITSRAACSKTARKSQTEEPAWSTMTVQTFTLRRNRPKTTSSMV